MTYDPELPNGFQDADIEMHDLEVAAAESARRRRNGECDHGWSQSYTAEHRPDLKPGEAECLHCGARFPDPFA